MQHDCLSSVGSLFHTCGVATEKILSPILRLVRGTKKLPLTDARSDVWEEPTRDITQLSRDPLQGRRQVKKCGVDTHGERGARAYNGGLGALLPAGCPRAEPWSGDQAGEALLKLKTF